MDPNDLLIGILLTTLACTTLYPTVRFLHYCSLVKHYAESHDQAELESADDKCTLWLRRALITFFGSIVVFVLGFLIIYYYGPP